MNVALHHLRKDIGRLRVLVFVWAVLLVLQAVSAAPELGVAPADARLHLIFVLLKALIPPLQLMTLLAIVPLLIHEDPVVGSTAFWLTRPISGRALLASKALFVVLFLAFPPLLIELVVLGSEDGSGQDFLPALGNLSLGKLKFLVLVFALAALTQTFSRFALAGVVLVVSYVIAGVAALVIEIYASGQYGAGGTVLLGSRSFAAELATVAFATGVIIHQYLTRKTRRSWVLLALSALMVFVLGKLDSGGSARPSKQSKMPPVESTSLPAQAFALGKPRNLSGSIIRSRLLQW
jgi:hypothetical protein